MAELTGLDYTNAIKLEFERLQTENKEMKELLVMAIADISAVNFVVFMIMITTFVQIQTLIVTKAMVLNGSIKTDLTSYFRRHPLNESYKNH